MSTSRPPPTLTTKALATSATPSSCPALAPNQILLSGSTLTLALALSGTLTLLLLLALAHLTHRALLRRRQTASARKWGRASTYRHRISHLRTAVDAAYSLQYGGCLHGIAENPELGSDSPVEIMDVDVRAEGWVWEVPAVPARAAREARRTSKLSLIFDEGVGVWMARR
ncbi:hypothetical protein LTR08_001238 [Meristemomyces frigidus]|nr:hypothetical protein LTR08_001238 [Meristemomyces frigidus]